MTTKQIEDAAKELEHYFLGENGPDSDSNVVEILTRHFPPSPPFDGERSAEDWAIAFDKDCEQKGGYDSEQDFIPIIQQIQSNSRLAGRIAGLKEAVGQDLDKAVSLSPKPMQEIAMAAFRISATAHNELIKQL